MTPIQRTAMYREDGEIIVTSEEQRQQARLDGYKDSHLDVPQKPIKKVIEETKQEIKEEILEEETEEISVESEQPKRRGRPPKRTNV